MYNYPVSQKKTVALLLPITLPYIDRYAEFFHLQTQQKTCNELIVNIVRVATLSCET